ncbi:hypothetical protein ACJ6WD_39915 [Streptomyces sp. VTCC 41912]|uniref:hypothetical protein n=1 Tax=Streptomyces sp. VTCC 41912 TaxID=3383243 RepID=UPI003896B9CE
MSRFDWLRPGADRELAATRYAGRESATDRAARKEAEASAARGRGSRRAAADPVDALDRNGFPRRRKGWAK